MPKPSREPVFKHKIQTEVYDFLCKKKLTYLDGANIFGFRSKQAMYRWLTDGGPNGKNWERVEKKIKELREQDER